MKIRPKPHEWEITPYGPNKENDEPNYFLWFDDNLLRLASVSNFAETVDFATQREIDELIGRLVKARLALPWNAVED